MGPQTTVRASNKNYQVSLACPWCGFLTRTLGQLLTRPRRPGQRAPQDWYLVATCGNDVGCGRPSILKLTNTNIDQAEPQLATVYPARVASYQEPGVPPIVAKDFEEALRCRANDCLFGAALVGRRVVQMVARAIIGGSRANLAAEINAIPVNLLGERVRDAAHRVRLLGNAAAHAESVTEAEVDQLLDFVGTFLHQLYALPHKLGLPMPTAPSILRADEQQASTPEE